jgi:hypothetical protein
VILDTFDSNSDTVLSIWIGTSHPLIELACNDDANEEQAQSQLSMAFSVGETYYINVSYSLLDEPDKSVILALKATSNTTFEEMAAVGMGIYPNGEFFDTNSYFISLMTTNSGLSGNNLKIDKTDEVTLSATIKIDALHIGENADILMVAIYKTEGNMLPISIAVAKSSLGGIAKACEIGSTINKSLKNFAKLYFIVFLFLDRTT